MTTGENEKVSMTWSVFPQVQNGCFARKFGKDGDWAMGQGTESREDTLMKVSVKAAQERETERDQPG